MGKWCLHASLFLGNKDMFKNYKRFDFWHVQTADIGGIKPWKTIAVLFESYSNFYWLYLLACLKWEDVGTLDSGEWSLPFGLLVNLAIIRLLHLVNNVW